MNVTVVAILITGCLGIISHLLESYKKINRNYRLGSWIFRILTVLGVGFATAAALKEDDQWDQLTNDNKTRFNSTMETLRASVGSAKLLLDSIAIVKRNIDALNEALQQEVTLQKHITRTTDSILQKSGGIAQSQLTLLQTGERLLNPLFPLHINIEIKVPIESPRLSAFKAFIFSYIERVIDSPFVSEDLYYSNNDYKGGGSNKNIRIHVKKTNSIFQQEGLTGLANYKLFLCKGSTFLNFDRSTIDPKMVFFIGEPEFDIVIDTNRKDFKFDISSFIEKPNYDMTLTNTHIGIQDLEDCYIALTTESLVMDYRVTELSFSHTQNSAGQLRIKAPYDMKRRDFTWVSGKRGEEVIFFHKITRKDFPYGRR